MEYRNLEPKGSGAIEGGKAQEPCREAPLQVARSGVHHRLRSVIVVLFALILALGVWPPVAHADDLDDLKTAVSDAEKEFSKAEEAERAAHKKIAENNSAQKRAQGEELQRLKSAAVELKSTWRAAESTRMKTERTLATKRGELRKEASKVAEEQLSAKGDVNSRAKRAGEALETWRAAMGELLAAPEVRKTEGLDDAEANAQKQDDKQRLRDFISWAETEKSNIETETKRAEALVKGEDKFKGADGQARLLNDCKQLKSDLESRKSSIEKSIKAAHSSLKTLEK